VDRVNTIVLRRIKNEAYIEEEKEEEVGMVITYEYLKAQEYSHVRQMKNRKWIALHKNIYTVGLCIDLGEFGYAYRYCYVNFIDALEAFNKYEGEGDPIGPWVKVKGLDVEERLGPGAKGEVV
jgi:hypothetical protein